MVEYASTFLMSHCLRPIVAANSAVTVPITATVMQAVVDIAKSALLRAMRYTPAVTIVAAWMSADTGVGPAIASGNHTYSGIWALLPAHPRNRNRQIAVTTGPPNSSAVAPERIAVKSSVPRLANSRNMAMRKPVSPMRLTRNAFLPASAFTLSLNQKPTSRYEQTPTPSQPTNSTG